MNSHSDERTPELTDDDALAIRLASLYDAPIPSDLTERVNAWLGAAESGEESAPEAPPRRISAPAGFVTVGLRIAAIFTLLVVAVSGASATGLIDWRSAWDWGFDTDQIEEDGLSTEIDQTQVVDGFRISIGSGYADPALFTFDATVELPAELRNRANSFETIRVYDETGESLGAEAVSEVVDGRRTMQFFPRNPEPGATDVTYRVVFEDLRAWLRPNPDGTEVRVCPQVPGLQSESWETMTCTYPVQTAPEFIVTLPLGPGMSVVAGEQIAGNGAVADVWSLTSGRIGTRLWVAGVGFRAEVWIEVAGKRYDLGVYLGAYACPLPIDRPIGFQTGESIPLDQGPWVVHIVASPDQAPPIGGEYGPTPCYEFVPDGEWTFTVDPATAAVGPATE